MKYTGFKDCRISRLGFGTMRLPMHPDGTIDYETGKEMVDSAIAGGITYFDTAYKYHAGESENFCREALTKRYPRGSYYLADKMPAWLCKTQQDVKDIFEDQLKKCGVDYFDFYLLHNVDEEVWPLIQELDIVSLMKEEMAKGRIRHLGLSVHCEPELLREVLEKHGSDLEFVQIQLNYMDWDYINAKELYHICREYNKPIIIMEPLRGGMLSNPLSERSRNILDEAGKERGLSYTDMAFGFVDSLEGIICTLSGMSTPEQMKENIEFFSGDGLDENQLKAISEAADALKSDLFIPCTGCGYCFECPQEIQIPKIFSAYNEAAAKGFHYIWGSLTGIYKELGPNGKDCIGCGNCESHCPQKIKIIDLLKQIDDKYTELEKVGE